MLYCGHVATFIKPTGGMESFKFCTVDLSNTSKESQKWMLVWCQPLQHPLPQSSNWVSEFLLPLCKDLNASGVVMSGKCLQVMWLSIFFKQMLSFPFTVKWISGDALVSLLIFWYGNSRTNSGEWLYYLFLAALEGNSGSGRGVEPEQSRYQQQRLPRETVRG